MQTDQARKIVKETLENPFDKARFVYFIQNLLNLNTDQLEDKHPYSGKYIPDAYNKYISTMQRVAKYIDGDNELDVLVVNLKREQSLQRARTAQRNFIAWYLNGSRGGKLKDGALVAFVSPDEKDWRFSLIKMEYKFEEGKNGKVKAKEEFTPAKRWSFLVGSNENSHTAQSQLTPIIEDDNHNPTLKQLEDAFNIEKVTKEFFEKYRDLFLRTKESLDDLVKNDSILKKDFDEKTVDTADFSKKLLGQIVFLYFLQKKGWFGVEQGKNWGSGSKRFMRDLFERKIIDYKNFFNDVLEPLFYDALARDRSDIDHFNHHFKCKIPFLNGGLFDPINGYSWEKTEINLPDDLFSNDRKTKEGDKGDGILDIFDRYNFTVKEDEPLEKEVAVDPEMLGKVFENLLEVKDRKSKGTYYTPREIVHYMCEQSLINYLATELEGKVSKEDLEKLIKFGESVSEHEAAYIAKKEDNPEYTGDYRQILPSSIEKFAKEIDDKLATIKVCDPAIGSGAFPVGMMSEIVKARAVLSNYMKEANRTIYDFKRDCIQNSLYGVDLDPGAVEIAKLRLWLSLVVDEDEIKQIKPLPNLDYKIMQGNSLLEEFEGIKLFDEKLITTSSLSNDAEIERLKQKQTVLQKEYFELHSENKLSPTKQDELNTELKKVQIQLKKLDEPEKRTIENVGLFDIYSEVKAKADELKRLHKKFFGTTHKSEKDSIKKQIEQLEWELIEATLKEQNKVSAIKKLEEFKQSNIKPFFLWKLNFADVFEEKGGFDVVIANPPYLRVQGIDNDLSEQYKKIYESATGKYDLYVLFVELASKIAKDYGIVNFIMPDKWTNAAFGVGLRTLISKGQNLFKLISFGSYQVFNASTYTSLVWLKKRINQHAYYLELERNLNTNTELDNFLRTITLTDFSEINSNTFDEKPWMLTDTRTSRLLNKMKNQPYTIKSEFKGIYQGIVTTGDDIFYMKGEFKNDHFYGFSERLKSSVILEKELIKPLLMGDDIPRYSPRLKNKVFVIYPHYLDNGKTKPYEEEELKDHFPKIYNYLSKFKNELQDKKIKYKTNAKYWYSLHRAREINLFEQEKIITPYLSLKGSMTIDKNNFYTNAKCYNLIKKEGSKNYNFYLAILNSKLLWFYLKSTGTVFRGNYLAYTSDYLDNFPLPESRNSEDTNKVEHLVEKIFKAKAGDLNHKVIVELENQIDDIVYKLYDLTKEEKEIIRNS